MAPRPSVSSVGAPVTGHCATAPAVRDALDSYTGSPEAGHHVTPRSIHVFGWPRRRVAGRNALVAPSYHHASGPATRAGTHGPRDVPITHLLQQTPPTHHESPHCTSHESPNRTSLTSRAGETAATVPTAHHWVGRRPPRQIAAATVAATLAASHPHRIRSHRRCRCQHSVVEAGVNSGVALKRPAAAIVAAAQRWRRWQRQRRCASWRSSLSQYHPLAVRGILPNLRGTGCPAPG